MQHAFQGQTAATSTPSSQEGSRGRKPSKQITAAWAAANKYVVRPSVLCLLAAAGIGASGEETNELFAIHELDAGLATRQTLLTGSFTGSAVAEIVTIDRLAGRNRQWRLHRLEDDERVGDRERSPWRFVRQAPLDVRALFVDVVHLDGRDHVVFGLRDGLSVFDVGAAAERVFVPLTTNFRTSDDGGLPRVDVTQDLDDDGRDDLVVPSADGFWIARQLAAGTFAPVVKLGPREPYLTATAYGEPRTYGETGITVENMPWYLGRLHRLDYDRDGRTDLAFWNEDHFDIHRQRSDGGFSATPEEFVPAVSFDFDGAYALAFQVGDRGVPSLLLGLGKRLDYTLLHGLRDLNGDGVADLITLSIAGRRVFSLRGRFDFHFGKPTPGGTAFAATPDASVETPGPAGGLAWGYATQRYLDIDGDGLVDIGMASVDTDLGGMFRALAGKSIAIDLALHLLRDGSYSPRPAAARRVRTAFSPFQKGVLFPTVLLGDVNGDGRMDLLIGDRWHRLSVFLGVAGRELFAAEGIGVEVDVPANEANARLVDLNRDGRQDVVIHHPSETSANRVVVLMARPSA